MVAAPVPAPEDAGVPAARVRRLDRQHAAGPQQARDATDRVTRVARVLDHLVYESEPEPPVPAREIEGLEVARAHLEAAFGRAPRRCVSHFDARKVPS